MPKAKVTKEKDKAAEETSSKKADRNYKELIDQVVTEYKEAIEYIRPKWDKWKTRLALYNNQKRDSTAVGDPLLFTIHQTVLASLYDDRLTVNFGGREEGDEDAEENLNALAEYDYEDMGKDEVDYEWDWDASFFGRGVLLFMEYDRKTYTPIPEVVDIMTFLRDPKAKSINGDKRGRGACRFFGREIRLTKDEMKARNKSKSEVYFNIGQIKSGSGESEIDQNRKARQEAQGYTVQPESSIKGDNKDYRILEWFTHYDGKKVLVSLANDNKVVIRYQELEDDVWPAVDRTLYPVSHDWDGVTVPDLVEDKQRARARMQNFGLKTVEAGLYSAYTYNQNKITNKKHLNFEQNKFIPIDGDPNGIFAEVPRSHLGADVGWIMQLLDTGAQKATATPDIQQGATSSERRTATEIGVIAQKVDTRYSLSAKIFGWSEKRFWRQWYKLYKKHFHEKIDEKVIRIVGSGGPRWRKLTRENLILNTDPDIKIESKVISEAKRVQELQAFINFGKMAMAEPESNRRFILKRMGKLSGLRRDEIDMALPKTTHELDAESENESLDNNKLEEVLITDDHQAHLIIHEKAADTPARKAHVNAHIKAMRVKNLNPALVPPSQSETPIPGQNQPSTPMPRPAMAPAMGGGAPLMQ
ncbi:MAG: hypothetical protein PHC53_02605 [Patescibacteria group bacterium]|nr:hypothetical protein [Patescibacteria group bacterium]